MKIFIQNVFHRWPFEDKSVQAIITSPPYWGLRKYSIPDVVIGGEKVAEELGREGIGIDLGYEDIQKRRLREIQKELEVRQK